MPLDPTPGILSPISDKTPASYPVEINISDMKEASSAVDNLQKEVSASYKCNIDSLLDEMQEPREDVNEGKAPADQTANPSYINNKPPIQEPKKLSPEEKGLREKQARWEAHFLAKNNDTLQAFLCSIIALDEDSDYYKADKEDVLDLENQIFEMRKDAATHLPPWVGIVIGMLLMYGPKYKEAIHERRINKALVEKAARAEAEKMTAMEELKQAKAKMEEFMNNAKAEKTANQEQQNKKTEETKKEPVNFNELK
jgi:hypothetical protein